MSESLHRLPVVIVCGLHTEARKAVVDHLLQSSHASRRGGPPPRSVGRNGPIHRSIHDAHGVLESGETPLVNDCACCALREDLVPVLM